MHVVLYLGQGSDIGNLKGDGSIFYKKVGTNSSGETFRVLKEKEEKQYSE